MTRRGRRRVSHHGLTDRHTRQKWHAAEATWLKGPSRKSAQGPLVATRRTATFESADERATAVRVLRDDGHGGTAAGVRARCNPRQHCRLERDNQKAGGPLLDLADPSATELHVPGS
jgi:hypothetical protein